MKLNLVGGIFLVTVLAFITHLLAALLGIGLSYALSFLNNAILQNTISSITGIFLAITLCILWNRIIFKNSLSNLLEEIKLYNGKKIIFWICFSLFLITFLIGIFLLLNGLEINTYYEVSWYKAIISALSLSVLSGFTEELCYRYLLYGYIKQKTSIRNAIIISGLIFGVMHLHQVSSISGGLLLITAGLAVTYLFVAIYEYSGSVFYSAIFHSIWNAITIGTGFVFTNNLDNSETEADNKYLVLKVVSDSKLVNGGEFGPDASLISTLVYAIFASFLFYLIQERSR